jgi:hypothetical protein
MVTSDQPANAPIDGFLRLQAAQQFFRLGRSLPFAVRAHGASVLRLAVFDADIERQRRDLQNFLRCFVQLLPAPWPARNPYTFKKLLIRRASPR